MQIDSLSVNSGQQTAYDGTTAAQETAAAQNSAAVTDGNDDVFEPSGHTEETRKSYKPDIKRLKEILAEGERQVESFRRLVESLLQKQAEKSEWAYGKPSFEFDEMVEIDEETRAAAQKEIEDGGYYSADQTATRLLDFAVALTGGDPSKISLMKDAFEKGFAAATEAWGKELPEISKQTYDAVMNGFDEWQEAGSSKAITLLNKENETVTEKQAG